jgi:hypothetical protein
MRLGPGLWVSGGFGIFLVYMLTWMIAISIGALVTIGLLAAWLIGAVILYTIKQRKAREKHEEDVALARRITAQKVERVEYLDGGRTIPPALWGVYMVEPSYGSPYTQCGQHPAALRKLWFENRCGTVRELMVLPDKPMANALLELLKRGVCNVKPTAAGIVRGFTASGKPILKADGHQ